MLFPVCVFLSWGVFEFSIYSLLFYFVCVVSYVVEINLIFFERSRLLGWQQQDKGNRGKRGGRRRKEAEGVFNYGSAIPFSIFFLFRRWGSFFLGGIWEP